MDMPDKPAIRCDASAAIGFADCVEGVGRMKHIDLRENSIQEMRSDKTITEKCDGKVNKADSFTKILPLCGFQEIEDDLMPRFEIG